MYERESRLKESNPEIQTLPIVLLKGDRERMKDPHDHYLQEIHTRTKKVWENDLDYYVSQAISYGWKKAWKLFLHEVLFIRVGNSDILNIPALKYKIKEKVAYSVFLPASIALQLSHVERARKKAPDDMYQRPLDTDRIKEIAEDLSVISSLNTCFPNSIVASFDNSILDKIKLRNNIWFPIETNSKNDSNSEIGFIQFPLIYGLLKVIDGQHRVFAHDRIEADKINNYGLPFTILENLKRQEEMILFKSINTTSEEVNPNLVDIILYSMEDHQSDRGLAASIICHIEFDDEEWVEIFDHLGTGLLSYDKNKRGTSIKINNIVQPLYRKGSDYDLIKENNKGYLNPENEDDKITYATVILKYYFTALKEKFKRNDYKFWYDYIRKRAGIRLMLMFLSNWIKKKNLRGELKEEMKNKINPLIELIFANKNIIKTQFEDSKGRSRGDEFLKNEIIGKII